MTMNAEGNLTDDPIMKPLDGRLAVLPAGTPVTALAYTGDDNHWTYVETTVNNQPARGLWPPANCSKTWYHVSNNTKDFGGFLSGSPRKAGKMRRI